VFKRWAEGKKSKRNRKGGREKTWRAQWKSGERAGVVERMINKEEATKSVLQGGN
jgi:hypothetical protein